MNRCAGGKKFVLWSCIAIFFFVGRFSANAAASVTAQFDRSTVMTGESANLSIVIEGGPPQSAEPIPNVSGLSIQYRGRSQNTTIINGQTSSRELLNYSVTASQPGQYTIPSIKVVVGGTSYSTQPVTLTVTKADPSIQNRYAFLRLNVPKTEIYVGEILPIELQLYVVDAENLQQPQLKSESFIVHKQLEHTRSQAQIGNVLYSVLTFPMTISAAKAGKLALGPAEMNLVLRIRTQPDPNDLFGFFGRYQRRAITLNSTPMEINVLPLPSPAPAAFTGAIGTFRWSVSAAPTNLNAGDPITVKFEILGRGNLDNLKLPELNLVGFRSYQPSSSVSSNDPLGIEGTKTFEQVLIPQDGSIREIPPLAFAYFDPTKRAFAHLTNGATPLKVVAVAGTGSTGSNLQNGSDAGETTETRADIIHIKTENTQFARVEPLIQQGWFLAVQAIPMAGLIGFTIWRRRQDHLAHNPKIRRKIEVQRGMESGIAELRHLASANETEEFYALLFRLMQEQIGERLSLPASAITEAVLDDRLPQRGAAPALIQRLHKLFQISNQARYAPNATHSELLSLCSDLEIAVRELQQLPD
jgi:hypothetical protein